MNIIAQLFQKGKLFQHNISFAQNIFKFSQHAVHQHAPGAPALFGVRKIQHNAAVTGEHIEDGLDLGIEGLILTGKPQIQGARPGSLLYRLGFRLRRIASKSEMGRARLMTIWGSLSSRRDSRPVTTTGLFSRR